MELIEQYGLIHQKKWTELLKGLAIGETTTLSFPSTEAIHSFKSVAYALNSDRKGRKYSIDADKGRLIVKVSVKSA